MKTFSRLISSVTLLLLTSVFTVNADQVVLDDQIINGSLCVGAGCINGEEFGFDTIRLKTDNPQILFQDTSNTASFPTNDWLVGATDNAMSSPTVFFIKDVTGNNNVLVLEPGQTGGVAIGAGSVVETNNISIGAVGAERKIVHVADGVDDTDAVNMRQFNQFTTTLNNTANARVDSRIDAINARLDALIARLNSL